MCLSRWSSDNSAQVGDSHLLFLDLLGTLPLLDDLLNELLLVDVMDVHAAEEVFLLVSLPEHVQLLLSIIVLLNNVANFIDFALSLLQPSVVVLDLLFVLMLNFFKVALNYFISPMIVVL